MGRRRISYTWWPYDELGERTETTPSTGSATTYGYDQTGNLISVERPKECEVADDQQGSTRVITGTTGAVEGTYTYTPYGNLTGHTGAATTPLGYDGQYTSTDTGLIYLRARVYDPATAQFLTVDPQVKATRAAYNYASDNPANRADPTGLESACETPAEKRELEREERRQTTEEEEAAVNERVRNAREAHLKALEELVAEEDANERHNEGESEGEQREHVIERCVGGIAVRGTESWVVKTKGITPLGALVSCAAGIYGPVLTEGIQSVLE